MRKPRLLFVGSFVVGHREQGGLHAQCMSLVAALRDRVEFELLDSTPPYLPPPPVALRSWHALKRTGRLVWILLTRRPDAALIFSSAGTSFLEKGLMAALARLFGVPAIWSVRGGVFRDQVDCSPAFARIARRLLRSATRVMCQGESWAHFYAQLGIAPGRVFVVPNWLDASRFLALPRSPRAASEPVRVLFVGHVRVEKGVYELIDALLSRELTHIAAEIVGDGAARQELMAKVAAAGATERIQFPGWRTGAELLHCYARADLLVLPSYAEGFPNVVLEAMAAGLPVIVTPVGAVPDVVTDGRNGLIVPARDTAALTRAIAALAADTGRRQTMGEINRQAVGRHAIEHASSRIYRELSEISPAFAR